MRPVSDILRIVANGGGLKIDCSKHMVSDLIRIASAASQHHSLVVLENCSGLMTSDAIRIASAGNGSVFFNDLV